MAEDLTTILRFDGDPANAQAAISGLIGSLRKAAQDSQSLFSGLGKELETGLAPLVNEPKKIAPGMRDAEAAALRLAQATARLQVAQGQSAAAATTLKDALAGTTKETVGTLNAKRQLISIEAQAANAAGKAETAILREAQALARLQQISGNTPAAIKTLSDALEKVSNKSSLPALRAELQKTYLDTGYANSPLVGMLQQINQGLGVLRPLLGSNAGLLQQLTTFAGQAAQSLGNTRTNVDANAKSAGAFFERVKQVNPAIVNFGKDQGGSASATDFFLNLSKAAGVAGDKVRATFASIKESITNGLGRATGNSSPFTSLFNGAEAAQAQVSALTGQLPALASGSEAAASSVTGLGAAGGATGAILGGVALAIGAVVLAIAGIVAVASGAVSGLESIGTTGVKINADLENVRNGIATVVASVADIQNSDGLQLKGVDALNAALPVAADQMRKLRIDALETSATVADIAPAFQAAIGPGLAAGLNIDQIRENTIKLTQAVTALGLPMDQIKQETRAILSGDINRNTQAAQALGITRQAVLEAQKQGKFAEFLEEKLKAAAAAGKLVSQSFTSVASNLKEAADTFQATVTEGLFDQLKKSGNEILPQIFDKNQANLISQNFAGIADTLTRIFDTAGSDATKAITFIFDGIKQISAFLDANKATVGEIVESVNQVVVVTAEVIANVVRIAAGGGDAGERLQTVSNILIGTVRVVAFIGDLIQQQVAFWKIVGGTIVAFVLTPVEALLRALAFVGQIIPGVSGALNSARDNVTAINKQAVEAAIDGSKKLISTLANTGKAGEEAVKRINDARNRAAAGQRAVPGLDRPENKPTGATIKPPKKPPEDDKGKGDRGAQARAAQEAQIQLKGLQLQEKQAELANRRITEGLRASLQDRLISLQTFTELSISADRDLLASRLAVIEKEKAIIEQGAGNEAAAVNRTVKNRTVAAEKIALIEQKKNEKLAELDLKASQVQQETDIRDEQLRDEARRAREKAEIDHANRLVEIRDIARRQAEQQIRNAASIGVIGAVAAEQQLIEIERQRFDERAALLQRDLVLAKADETERARINDELIKLEAERAAFNEEASQRIRNAGLKEIETRLSLLRGLIGAYADLKRAQIDQQATQTELAQQRGQLSGRDARVQQIEQQKQIAALESEQREQSIKDQAEGLKRQAILAGAGADRIVEIERLKNAALAAERLRAADQQRILEEQQLALIQSTSGGIRGLFSARVNELANNLGLARGLISKFVEDLKASIVPLDEIGAKAFQGFADGIGQAVSNFVLLGKTGPAVLRKILAEQLAMIAKEATVNAIKELALGFATLFINPAEAGGHFTSAALWASLAGASALVGRAIAPKEAAGGGAQNNQQTDENGQRVIEQGGPLPTQQIIVRPQITLNQPINLQGDIRNGVLQVWHDDFNDNGSTRRALRSDLLGEPG